MYNNLLIILFNIFDIHLITLILNNNKNNKNIFKKENKGKRISFHNMLFQDVKLINLI